MQSSQSRNGLYNFIAILMLLASLAVVIVVLAILANPDSPLNPFQPSTSGEVALPTPAHIPTSTATLAIPTLPATFTPSATVTAGATVTSSPTPTVTPTVTITTTKVFTPTPTLTPSPTGPTPTFTPTTSPFPYILQAGTPRATQYFANPAVGCDWSGIAGQVFDKNGFGQIGITIHVFGSGLDEKSTSGSFTGTYGPGGWEIFITNTPVARTYTVRIENALGEAQSADVPVQTIDSCSANLVIVNFVEVP